MLFTLVMVIGPFVLVALAFIAFGAAPGDRPPHPLAIAGVLWLFASIVLVPLYWAARVVRLAWRAGTRRRRDA